MARWWRVLWLGSVLVLAGCGKKTGSVTGKVLFDEKPLNLGTVVIIGSDGQPKAGAIREDGTFVVDAVSLGQAQIAVTSPAADQDAELIKQRRDRNALARFPVGKEFLRTGEALPQHYNHPQSSNLAFEVKSGGNEFVIHLKRVPPSETRDTIVDDADPGYTETGAAWDKGSPDSAKKAYKEAYRKNHKGPVTARWTCKDLKPGDYQVFVTWVADEQANTAWAPYKIFDGEDLKRTVSVSQKVSPDGEEVQGQTWQRLGFYSIASGTLVVELDGNQSRGLKTAQLCADAIRVVKVDLERAKAPRIAVAADSTEYIIDDADAAFTEDGLGWVTGDLAELPYFNKSYRLSSKEALAARWVFQDLPSRSYDVYATWVGRPERPFAVPYKIYDRETLVSSVNVNQKNRPGDEDVHGQPWKKLATVSVTKGTLIVELDAGAGKSGILNACADAIRVVSTPVLTKETKARP